MDDNRDAADSLADLLRYCGVETEVIYESASTLEAVERFRPRVVLLDIGMPGMDGCALARKIRSRPQYDTVSLIAVTGWNDEATRARTREAGFDHHIAKPARLEPLISLMRSLPAG